MVLWADRTQVCNPVSFSFRGRDGDDKKKGGGFVMCDVGCGMLDGEEGLLCRGYESAGLSEILE